MRLLLLDIYGFNGWAIAAKVTGRTTVIAWSGAGGPDLDFIER